MIIIIIVDENVRTRFGDNRCASVASSSEPTETIIIGRLAQSSVIVGDPDELHNSYPPSRHKSR